ncbi:MAG: UDP-N-acetylmuramate dehydrogenase [Bryobacteraceae bacterium]
MLTAEETEARLTEIPQLTILRSAPLAGYTRFGIGGEADWLVDAASVPAFIAALEVARRAGLASAVIGGGTNLVVSDAGFRGMVLRFRAAAIRAEGACVSVQAGADLQELVDFTTARGLKGLETLAGIPGWVGAAIYGNAGAYGHSISERVARVEYFDGAAVRQLDHSACQFRYRESIFKQHKEWIVLSAELRMEQAEAAELQAATGEIVAVRNRKFPPTMKCAGSIFKNLLLAELPGPLQSEIPASTVREGKVPAAWFLERIGAKSLQRGGIRVADYHANLIYNAGGGTAAELRELIGELEAKVEARFGILLAPEVQFVG